MTLLKEIQGDTNRRIYHFYGFKELISLKYPGYLKTSIDLMESLSKFQQHFFTEIEKNNPKYLMKPQKPSNSQSNCEIEENQRNHNS